MITQSLMSFTALLVVAADTDPHVHGEATLSISSDGKQLFTELTVDQHTAFGFEGHAESKAQKARVADVTSRIGASGALFQISSNVTCTPSPIEVRLGESDDGWGIEEDHEDHDHDHHNHDDHEEHDDHRDHDDLHQDVTIREVYTCARPPKIESVKLSGFELFPDLNKVNVIVLTDNQQAELTARRNQTTVRFP